MYFIGIDVGGTGLKVGVVDENGKIYSKVSCPTGIERGHEPVIHDMCTLAMKAAEEANIAWEDIVSVGVGIPGLHDNITKRVPFCTNLKWHNVPLIDLMEKELHKPVYVDNDANVAGLAESVAGATRGCKSSIIVTLGTGVGGGIIINGRIFTGSHGVASEIGHIITVAGGEMCTCGNRGCWERYASATALIREGRKFASENPDSRLAQSVGGDLSKIEARSVIDLAKEGDPGCVELFDNYVEHLCVGLVTLVNVYDPEVIALGGGVSKAGDFLLDKVNARLPGMIFFKSMPYARIVLAEMGNDAGIIGAAMLGMQEN